MQQFQLYFENRNCYNQLYIDIDILLTNVGDKDDQVHQQYPNLVLNISPTFVANSDAYLSVWKSILERIGVLIFPLF